MYAHHNVVAKFDNSPLPGEARPCTSPPALIIQRLTLSLWHRHHLRLQTSILTAPGIHQEPVQNCCGWASLGKAATDVREEGLGGLHAGVGEPKRGQ